MASTPKFAAASACFLLNAAAYLAFTRLALSSSYFLVSLLGLGLDGSGLSSGSSALVLGTQSAASLSGSYGREGLSGTTGAGGSTFGSFFGRGGLAALIETWLSCLTTVPT
jgi:hypothetical protein